MFQRENEKKNRKNQAGLKYLSMAGVGIFAIAVAGYVALRMIDAAQSAAGAPGDAVVGMAKVVADSFKPKVTVKTIMLSAVESVKKESKLVVQSAKISVKIDTYSRKTAMWDLIDLGTSSVELWAVQNCVQYYIPTKVLTTDMFVWDDRTKTIVIKNLPPPILDEDIVEVQSDPAKILIKTRNGWCRSVETTEKLEVQMRKLLRKAVLREGRKKSLMEKAAHARDEVVKETFLKFLEKKNLADGIKFVFDR